MHVSHLCATKNISLALSFAHKSGKACGKNRKSSSNPPTFNAMVRFAPFLCNGISWRGLFDGLPEKSVRIRFARNPFARGFFSRYSSVPLRRTLEMYFNHLLGFGDVVPVTVGLPSIRDHLH